jgi:hypothetical protein
VLSTKNENDYTMVEISPRKMQKNFHSAKNSINNTERYTEDQIRKIEEMHLIIDNLNE